MTAGHELLEQTVVVRHNAGGGVVGAGTRRTIFCVGPACETSFSADLPTHPHLLGAPGRKVSPALIVQELHTGGVESCDEKLSEFLPCTASVATNRT